MSYENRPPVNPNKTYPLLEFYRVSKKVYVDSLKKNGFGLALELEEIPIPKRATKFSAGYDFVTPVDITLAPGELKFIPTGIKCKIDAVGKFLGLHLRSKMSFKKIILMNLTGIIDADYYNNEDNEGHIMIPLMNIGDESVHIAIGERIAQGIFYDYYVTDNDNATGVRKGGFGSTGSK